MTTNCMKDSIVGDEWIRQTAMAYPVQRIIDRTTGQPTGDILTGPVRLSWASLFELPPQRQGQSEPKFEATLMFTPFSDLSILKEEFNKACQTAFQQYFNPATGQYMVQSPFRDQAEKINYQGHTPGLVMMACRSKFKPPVIDVRHNPIIDKSKVYAGVWAICAINPYTYGISPPQPKRGVAFGLQSVMIIGDDTQLGGGAPDPKVTFAGISPTAPIQRPNLANGMPTAQPPQNALAAVYGQPQPQGFQPQPYQGPVQEKYEWE